MFQKRGNTFELACFLLLGILTASASLCMNDHIEGEVLGRHGDTINSVAFNPQGTLLASGSADTMVKVWDLRTKTLIYSLVGHTKEVTTVQFDRTGIILGSASRDGIIKLWNPYNGQLTKNIQSNNGRLNCLAFSPCHDLLAAGNEEFMVELWDPIAGLLVQTFENLLNPTNSLAWSPDGNFLAYTSDTDKIMIYSLLTNTFKQCDLHGNFICAIAFSPSNKYVAAKLLDAIVLFDFSTGIRRRRIPDNYENEYERHQAIAFDRKEEILVSQTENTITLWSANTGELLQELEGHTGAVHTLALNKRQTLLASGSADKTIMLWQDKRLEKQMTSFALALHQRCGSQSASRILSWPLMRYIHDILKENSSLFDQPQGEWTSRLIKTWQFFKKPCGMVCAMGPVLLTMMLIAINMNGRQ